MQRDGHHRPARRPGRGGDVLMSECDHDFQIVLDSGLVKCQRLFDGSGWRDCHDQSVPRCNAMRRRNATDVRMCELAAGHERQHRARLPEGGWASWFSGEPDAPDQSEPPAMCTFRNGRGDLCVLYADHDGWHRSHSVMDESEQTLRDRIAKLHSPKVIDVCMDEDEHDGSPCDCGTKQTVCAGCLATFKDIIGPWTDTEIPEQIIWPCATALVVAAS